MPLAQVRSHLGTFAVGAARKTEKAASYVDVRASRDRRKPVHLGIRKARQLVVTVSHILAGSRGCFLPARQGRQPLQVQCRALLLSSWSHRRPALCSPGRSGATGTSPHILQAQPARRLSAGGASASQLPFRGLSFPDSCSISSLLFELS